MYGIISGNIKILKKITKEMLLVGVPSVPMSDVSVDQGRQTHCEGHMAATNYTMVNSYQIPKYGVKNGTNRNSNNKVAKDGY